MTVRIQVGSLKGRRLPGVSDDVRPSMGWIRMVVMNWLRPVLPQARILDLCTGTGIYAIESLSLGAEYALCIDHNQHALHVLHSCIEAWGLSIETRRHVWPQQIHLPGDGFDIIFWDPPYQAPWRHHVFDWVEEGGWLRPGGIVCIESSVDDQYFHSEWMRVKHQKRGASRVELWEKIK